MTKQLKYKTLLGLGSTVFCLGCLISIVDGYYGYNHSNFIDEGRQDLLVRLGFLSWTNGFIYYPLVILGLGLASYVLKKTDLRVFRGQGIYMLCPAIVVGLLFYTHSIDVLIAWSNWQLGLLLIVVAILTYWVLLKFKIDK